MKCFTKKGLLYVSTACFCLISFRSPAVASPFEINSSAGLFTPSFRGAADTTWFGWGPGTFDGAPNDELIGNPPPSLGTTMVGVGLGQLDANDYLSGSNNIYSGGNSLNLALTVPTSGTVGSGFTTIVLQGRTIFGGYPTGDYGQDIDFAPVAGVNPIYVQGTNTAGQGQFWVKYELPGNAASYTVSIPSSAGAVSIAELQVDTAWSAADYASDVAFVPEPASLVMLLISGIPLVRKCRKAKGGRQ